MTDHNRPNEEQLQDFPSFRMSESTQAQMHDQIMQSLHNTDRQPKRNRMLINKVRIGLVAVAALVIFSILSLNMWNPNFNTGNDETPVPSEPEVVPEDDVDVEPPAEEVEVFDPATLEQQATELLQAINERDMNLLATYVHEEKGLLISPYYSVMDNTVRFEKDDIPSLMEDTSEHLWGYGEANTEIRLTPSAYWEKHLDVERFFTPDEVFVDQQNEEVDPANYLKSVFPDAKIVEFYHEGTAQYSNLDWRSLNLVFEQDAEGEWKLVAIVNNLFTP